MCWPVFLVPLAGRRAGSSGYVYALDVAGQRLAGLMTGGQVRRPWRLGRPFLAHSLAVTDVYVRLVLAERAGSLGLARFDGEPASWRRFFGPGGGRVVLKPDAHAVVLAGGYEDHWFLELDLGTEHTPTLARKCNIYRSYRRSGTEQAKHGVFPRVLWLVPDERRADVLRSVIRRQPQDAAEMFDVALSERGGGAGAPGGRAMTELPRNTILTGDAASVLADLPEASVDCVVTSPPYYQLRDYGIPGQLGLEPSVDGWAQSLLAVARQVARVLKPSGAFWLNLGDSFSRHRELRRPG